MNNTTFVRFPKAWVSNLEATCDFVVNDWLAHHSPPNIRAVIEFQDTLSEYLHGGDDVSQKTHDDLLGRLSAGLASLAALGATFDDDGGLLTDDNTKQQ